MNYDALKGYLIAVDLDGTIVSGFDDYDKVSFEILKQLAKNNYIVIATGRPYRSSKYFYDILNLSTPLINYNGALLHHPKDVNFEKKLIYIDKAKLMRFISSLEGILINCFSEIEDDIFLWKNTNEMLPYLHLDGGNLNIGNFEDILTNNPNGAILFSLPGSEEILEKTVNEIYGSEICIRHWYTKGFLVSELYSPMTSKANALKIICDYYNIPLDKTIAIGDGHNDIEMLEFVKYSVAMKNAHPDLLKVANVITEDIDNHGVALFFNNFIDNH